MRTPVRVVALVVLSAVTVAPRAASARGTSADSTIDADACFTRGGDTVYFARGANRASTIMTSHRVGNAWSAPLPASFSGRYYDAQPVLSPDGSFIVFVSTRPAGDPSVKGAGLWRADRTPSGWSEPVRLPATINRDASTWAPSIAGDGSIYFINRDPATKNFRIWRSQYRGGSYEPARALTFGDSTTQDVDPAVAPDESFIVFGSMHPGPTAVERLFIAFRNANGWSKPIDLGDAVNGPGDTNEGRLGPDHRTLYFSSARSGETSGAVTRLHAWDGGDLAIWSVSLAPWLDPHSAARRG